MTGPDDTHSLDRLIERGRTIAPVLPATRRDAILDAILDGPPAATVAPLVALDPPRSRRRWWIGGLALAVASAAAVLLAVAVPGPPAVSPAGGVGSGSHLAAPDDSPVQPGSSATSVAGMGSGSASYPGASVGNVVPASGSGSSAPQLVSPASLEQRRITGNRNIVPDPTTQLAMARAGVAQLLVSVRVCVGSDGYVTQVTVTKSSGFAAYDRKLETAIRAWTYRPLNLDGKAVPVCSVLQFMYSQR